SQSEITNWVKRIWFTSPRAIDVGWIRFTMSDGKISERIFLNIASFGISGLVDALVNASPKWMGGRAAFLIGTARALFQYKPQPVKITIDGGKVIEQEVMVVAVANGRCFGGGMCIAPKAQLDDGLLELTIVRRLSKPLDIDLLWRLYACRIHEHRDVHLERIRAIEATPLHSGQRIWLDVDGEAVGLLPAMIEVIPSSLWIKWPSTGQPW
ncbi:MAG: hypothetical protein RMJ84_13260, partial [Sandaracinaceae bacterium]|nr:hypothetical protein [Sandaracinaceae bacterium]